MSDTGIPKPVSGTDPRLQQARGEQPVRVENATGDLSSLSRTVRVEGTVTQQNNDGTVRISTPQGDLDVRARGANAPTLGQRVEVDVAAGRPPRQAVVRPAPEQPQQSSPSSARTAQNAAAAPNTDDTGDAPPASLLSDATATELAQQAPPAQNAPPPEVVIHPGDLARLTPLTPEEAAAAESSAATSTSSVQALPAASLVFQTTASAAEDLRLSITLPTQSEVAAPRARAPGESAHTLFSEAPRLNSQPVTLEVTAAPLAKSITPLGALDIRITSITSPGVSLVSPGAAAQKISTGVNPFFSPSTPATALEKARAALAGLPLPTSSAAPPASAAGSLTGTVIGQTDDGFPVLSVTLPGQTLPAYFALRLNAVNLTDGTVISFMPQAGTPALDAAQPAGPGLSSDLSPAFQWASFSSLKAVVTQIDPRIVQSFTQSLPNAAAPEQIPAAALFFVAALRSGDIVSWLGEKAVSAIKGAGRADAIDRLTKEMNDAGKAEGATKTPDDWHALPLPMVAGGDIQRMMLYYRHDQGTAQTAEEKKPRVTRFLFDMTLTKMGPVQLDGLHRPAEKDSKLDLIVRTREALSPTMQQAMRRSYIHALERTGHSGEMSFQHRPEQFIKVGGQGKSGT